MAIHNYLLDWRRISSIHLTGSYFYPAVKRVGIVYSIKNMNFIYGIVLPFFTLYDIQGVKAEDFKDYTKICNMVIKKEHLTPEGKKIIIALINNMNSRRKW